MKRIVSCLLMLAMVQICFAGCGASNTDTVDVSAAETQSIADAQEEVAADVAPDAEPDVASEEEPVISDSPVSTVYPLTEDTVTLTAWSKFAPDFPQAITDFYDYSALAKAEEITGVHIDFVNGGSTDTIEQNWHIQIAAGDYCDIQQYVNNYYGDERAIEDGIIIDVAPYLETLAPNYYALVNSDDEIRRNVVCNEDGEIGSFYIIKEDSVSMFGMIIRQDWLDELGLAVPVTYDDCYDVLTAFKTEYDCKSPYLLTEAGQDSSIISGYGVNGFNPQAMGAQHKYMYQVDGEVKMSVQQESYHDYLRMMHKWYQDGLISSDFTTQTANTFSEDFQKPITTGETGMFYSMGNFMTTFTDMATDPDFKLVGMNDPVLKEGDATHFRDTAKVLSTGVSMSVTTACEDPELAIRWCDFWYSYDGYMLWNYGIEGESYTLDDEGKVQITDLVIDNEWDAPASSAFMAYSMYCFTFASYVPLERMTLFYTDEQLQTFDAWIVGDGDYLLPTLNITDETYIFDCSELETYVNESILKFIVGEMDVEDDWDTFQSNLLDLGADYILETYQTAYEDYLRR